MITATGLMVKVGALSQVGVSALLFALVVVLLQVAPWIALAHIPVRILDADTAEQIPAQGVTDQVSTSFVFVVSLRAGGGLAALFLTVSMLSAPTLRSVSIPLILAVLGSASLILQTRSIRARVEVLLGALTGLTTILVSATLATRANPTSLAWVTLLRDCSRPRPRRDERRWPPRTSAPHAHRGHHFGALALCPDPSGRLPVGVSHAVE